jgi:hypothetical protein
MLVLALLGIGFSVVFFVATKTSGCNVHQILHDVEQPRRG